MQLTPLSEKDLALFERLISDRKNTISFLFAQLIELYDRQELNHIALKKFESLAEIIRIKKDYDLKKAHWDNELLELKKQYRQLDNRIIAAEQKMARGIPDDLLIMEKLITEQEAIVSDQEKLNQAESELISHVREIDIEYGKQQEKIKQRSTIYKPLADEDLSAREKIKKAEKKIVYATKIVSIISILFIPIVLDYLTRGLTSTIRTSHSIFAIHYIFIISLILTEVFFGDKIRQFISNFFASKYLKNDFDELKRLFEENTKSVNKLENLYKIKFDDVINQAS
ncbi:hypothetical protein QWY86_17990 [Pedobacter aquatilis]|uniref:hypothetical protein n=1 Tax=Pedobacter aquatilis TaxID=351343 RepID=UPI0025B5FEFF|nr:hypothetical protein [Pedobacter aquatilis]MDN3588578.1 hypothetical protein [Pedobacter aquatilis]